MTSRNDSNGLILYILSGIRHSDEIDIYFYAKKLGILT